MKKKIIKIRIDLEDTRVYYSNRYFKNRVEAIKASIQHLESILKLYDVKNIT